LIINCEYDNLVKASKLVKKGKIIAYPTDTVYGLGCIPYNDKSIRKIIELKKRQNKPLPLLCSSIEDVLKLVHSNKIMHKLSKMFWPGPLTIISLKKDLNLPDILTLNEKKLGVRIPNLDCTRKIIKLCGGCLVGTSANKSGSKPPTTPSGVLENFGDKLDLIIDGGSTPIGQESTVVDLTEGKPIILRKGAISNERIFDAIQKL
jgi:L-threonylcarbamoyladenylate synthase